MSGKTYPKHAIKRVNRLLGNRHLQTERSLFYWGGLPPGRYYKHHHRLIHMGDWRDPVAASNEETGSTGSTDQV